MQVWVVKDMFPVYMSTKLKTIGRGFAPTENLTNVDIQRRRRLAPVHKLHMSQILRCGAKPRRSVRSFVLA